MNAIKHGILSRVAVLPDEDPDEFNEFYKGMKTHLDPRGQAEDLIVERIITSAWKLRRVLVMENDILDHLRNVPSDKNKSVGMAYFRDISFKGSLGNLARYDGQVERSLFRSLDRLKELQSSRKP